MVWTVRWRGAEGLPTRAAFLIFLSIFFFTRWYLLGLSSPHRSKTPWQAAGCCLRLSARVAVFSLLLRWRRNIRLIIPVMRINRFIIWGINRRHRNDLTVCAGMFIPCMVCVVCVDLRCVVLDDDLYAGVEWVSDAEVAPASVIAMLFAAVRAAFTGCYRIFWIAAPFVPAAVVNGDVIPAHCSCVHKGFGRAPAGAAVE